MYNGAVIDGDANHPVKVTNKIEGSASSTAISANVVIETNSVVFQVHGGCTLTISGSITNADGGYAEPLAKTPRDSTGTLIDNTGTLVLRGPNTYTGGTIVSDGTVQLSGDNASLASSGAITVGADGTLDLGGHNQSVYGAVSIQGGVISNGTITKSGAAYDAQSGTVSATLAGSVGSTKTAAGALTLSGTNNYTGVTAVNGGVLSITSESNLGTNGGLSFNGGTLQITTTCTIDKTATLNAGGGTIDVTAGSSNDNVVTYSGQIQNGATPGPLTVGAATLMDTGTLALTYANAYTGATTINWNTLSLQQVDGNAIAHTSSVTMNHGGTLNLSGYNNVMGPVTLTSGAIEGPGTLTSSAYSLYNGVVYSSAVLGGAASLTQYSGAVSFSGTNVYTGSITISAGTLLLNSGNAIGSTSSVTIKDNGTLYNNGSFYNSMGPISLESGTIAGGTNSVLTATAYNVQSGTIRQSSAAAVP